MDLDLRVGLHAVNQVLERRLRVEGSRAQEGVRLIADMAPLAAELVVALEEVDGDVELSQEQGSGETCGTATGDEGAAGERLLGAEGEGVEAGHGAEPGDGHGDQRLGLGGEGAVVPVNMIG